MAVFFDDWSFAADYIYSRFRNPADFVDLSQVVDTTRGLNGLTLDGRPIYRAIDPLAPGCTAVLVSGGLSPQYRDINSACFATSRDDEIQLTNGNDYESHVASARLSKRWNRGIFTEGGSVLFNLGYAYTQADNNRYNASSTATSGYDITAAFDRQNSAVATSEYESRHNITFAMNFKEEIFSDYATQFGFVFVARSGRPFSYTFDNGGVFNDNASGVDNALLYVPTGPTDPNVVYADNVVSGVVTQTAAQARDGLDAYINGDKCLSGNRGRSIARNSCRNPWSYDVDLRISQELPGPGRLFGVEDKIQVYADFLNFLNLLSDGGNIAKARNYTTPLITGGVNSSGQYVLSGFAPDDVEFTNQSASLWRIQLGVRYEF